MPASDSDSTPARLGHHRVIEQIGAGGMGVVYRARDEHLDREVALKVLPPGLLADGHARDRFRTEALALSRLNHPNIATVFDFDTDQGRDYLAMELVGGETLAARVASGPMPEDEVRALGIQMAHALAAAHEAGVVHCDLKPGNMKVGTDGRLKILDFGLARLLQAGEAKDLATRTASFMVGGTLPYIAPELLAGTPPGPATDLYATGVVLYQMATGTLPFDHPSQVALMSMIASAPAPPVRRVNPRIGPALETIVMRLLAKDPEQRYPSAAALLADLQGSAAHERPGRGWANARRRLTRRAAAAVLVGTVLVVGGIGLRWWRAGHDATGGPPVPVRIQSIAVLPLANLSGDPGQEFFADGMTESLISALSNIRSLRVISRTSVMRYKGTTATLADIARALRVDAVVEGSVLRAGERVRITVNLIEPTTEGRLAGATLDRDVGDVLALHSEVATAIAQQVQASVTPQDTLRLRDTPRVDPAVNDAYMRARYLTRKFTAADVGKAVAELRDALEQAPTNAMLRAELARCYLLLALPLSGQDAVSPREYLARSMRQARLAVEEAPTSALAHALVGGGLLFGDWNWAGAGEAFRRALALDPNDVDVLENYAVFCGTVSRFGEADQYVQRAIVVDPLNPEVLTLRAEIQFHAGAFDRARAQLDQVLALEPAYDRALGLKFDLCRADGDIPCVLDLMDRGSAPPVFAAQARRTYNAGGRDAFQRFLADAIAKEVPEPGESPFLRARRHASVGANERALVLLEQAFAEHDSQMVFLNVTADLQGLHGDPRFEALVDRVGIPRPHGTTVRP